MEKNIEPKDVAPLVEAELNSILNNRLNQAMQIHPRYVLFWERIREIALNGGKRMRPYLVVVSYGKVDSDIIKIASAQELLHIAMLVHDDIIDKDFIRHGKDNISGLYKKEYQKTTANNATHFANSAAILAGDALISEAYQTIFATDFSKEIKQQLAKNLGNSIFEVIGGELLDVEASFLNNIDFDPMLVYRYKTAGYSFIGPIVTGYICSNNNNKNDANLLKKVAQLIGIAFQIQDDIIGVYGDESTTGKTSFGDLKEGKQTLLIKNHLQKMTQLQKTHFDNFFGNEFASDHDLLVLKQDLIDSGAVEEIRKAIEEFYKDAEQKIYNLEDQILANRLLNLINLLKDRRR